LVWFGLVWFGLVWFGLVWFGLVWFGLVWFGLVSYLAKNPNRFVLAGLLPGPDIYQQLLAGLYPYRGYIFRVPATFAPIKYLCSDCIMT